MMEWLDGNKIRIVPPTRPKKLTGTRFAAIFDLNKWSSPFEVWCAVTRTYEKPFEDTIYTLAGKAIEPKQAEYMKRAYFMRSLKTPTDIFGENYFSKTYGDFFKDYRVFGGMWDYLLYDGDGKPSAVLEMKTTKRSEDWTDDIPEYYALQAALYAYLLGVDDVIMVASFLEEHDYEKPEDFVPAADNTLVIPFKLSERYPDFQTRIDEARTWWRDHVESGISPEYDEKRDAEILKALRSNTLNPDTDMNEVIDEAERLQTSLDTAQKQLAESEKRLKVLKDIIKEHAVKAFREGDKSVVIPGRRYQWQVSRSERYDIDKKALETDGLLEKYTVAAAPTYKLTSKPIAAEV